MVPINDIIAIRRHIPALRQAKAITQIHKGYSADGKYFIHRKEEQPSYVLRTAPIQQSEKKKEEFDMIRRVYELGVYTSEPIAFGVVEEWGICYLVLGYVKGEDAAELLPGLTEDEQYVIGLEAGQELKLIHKVMAPLHMKSWNERRSNKYLQQLAEYQSCGVKLPEEDMVLRFIDDHLKLMDGRPNRFQHDDFHPANLLIYERRYSGVIDFNRFDWGDPYEEFQKVAYFTRHDSIPFSAGQIDGYFDGDVPEDFWPLYSLYTAMTMLPSITWTLKVVPQQLELMLGRIRTILEDHHQFENVVPSWYAAAKR
ncbi:phosphotransferase family protein [Paenibacillus cremeus]|uniref:Aminoglycoside phosphotransferase family protein n=1 Tax=Paenibacillus cremeus TaxID=2163881 RepID=A0A559KGT0_9BACL|nr:aminoglycoside phosphotransferase family protein [Paenibacillus cremeus]TVY11347.1 aminoglycoside phosphotransferase family protein [Paenibacillus cremeus]